MDAERFNQTYWKQLYNSFTNDLNIAAKGHFYP